MKDRPRVLLRKMHQVEIVGGFDFWLHWKLCAIAI